MKMSWKSGVYVIGQDTPNYNSCRFATKKEATTAGAELMSRWMQVVKHKAVRCKDPVNYRFDFEQYRALPLEVASAA